MKPFTLKEHLPKVHLELANKDLVYFKIKEHQLKQSRLYHGTGVLFQPSNVVKASYRISLLITKQKKPHAIREKFVKPCMVEAAHLVLDQNYVSKLNQISLSDNTVKQRIDDMSQDIKSQVIEKIKLSPFFAIQLDETTDIAHPPQLLVYAWFISENQVEEEFLLCSPLITTTKAEDIMNIVSNFFEEEKLSWAKLVGVCMDRAPSMFGSKSGFMTLVKTKNPDIITTHCLIHCEDFASKTLPAPLKDTLETVIHIVNHIKGGALTPGCFVGCAKTWILLTKTSLSTHLFVGCQRHLNEVIGEEPLAEELQQEIKEHLIILQEEFIRYFHETDRNENVQLTLARNPFRYTVDDLPDDIQEEFLELINNTAAKEEFQKQQPFNSSNCWIKMLSAFPKTSKFALKGLIPSYKRAGQQHMCC
ncbi:protein FAM200C-like [Macrobrachium rosenbergii]|uniref:protein FAM200C-like n=1 Tax=Macrobrachium rosenbergii TaxID=79674 RepID=UPI0034D51A0A